MAHMPTLFSRFHPHQQPWITRQSYRHELQHALSFPFALAMVEGAVIGVLAAKAFEMSPALFATIMAAPNFANVTSFFWARLARGQRKVSFINLLQIGMLVTTALIAVLPVSGYGPPLLTILIVLNRCFQTGVITIRSTVWRQNYPRQVRAQVTGRLTLINALLIAFVPLAGYALVDRNPQIFRVIYPLSAFIGLIGVWAYSRIRLRGERDLLRYENTQAARPQPHGAQGPIYEYDPNAPTGNFWTVLRKDRLFRNYMLWQFVNGVANMAGDTVLVYLIADMTRGMNNEYFVSISITNAIPMLVATLTLPMWARLLDRMHVIQFRSMGGWFWVGSQVGYYLGAMTGSLALLALARVIQGIARGGGMLAWNLGHNDFADRRMVAVYMGIHVTLTGVRGAIAPFLVMACYAGWGRQTLLGVQIPALPAIGYHVFAVTAILSLIAEWGFHSLVKQLPAQQTVGER